MIFKRLLDQIPSSDSTIVMGETVNNVVQDDESCHVMFVSGLSLRAKLVIGCDGCHSRIRELLTGGKSKHTGITVFRSWLSMKNAGCGEELQRMYFREGRNSNFMTGANLYLAIFAFPEDGLVNWVLTTNLSTEDSLTKLEQCKQLIAGSSLDNEDTAHLLSITDDGRIVKSSIYNVDLPLTDTKSIYDTMHALSPSELAEAYKSHISVALNAVSDDQELENNDGWGGFGRVTFMGDASHAMRPIDGQGAAMAFEDCVCLIRYLQQCVPEFLSIIQINDGIALSQVLRKFESARLPRVRLIQEDQNLKASFLYRGDDDVRLAWTQEFREWIYKGI